MSKYSLDAKRKRGKHIDTKKLNRDLAWRKSVSEKRKAMCQHLSSKGSLEKVDRCPICGVKKYKLFTTIFDYPYHECGKCGHIYLATPPTESAIKDLYSGEGENTTIQGDIYIGEEIFKERVKQIARPKVDFCLDHMKLPELWIDVGCGTGEVLTALKERDVLAFGVESDDQEVKFASEHGLKVVRADLLELGEKFFAKAECVSFINILEHIKDPVGTLGRVLDSMPYESSVVIEVPRHPSLSSYNSMAFSSLAYRHIYAPDHLHIFTEKSLKMMFNEVGLKEVAIWEYGQDFQDLISMSAINADLDETGFVSDIMDLFNNIQQSIDNLGFSDTMFIIGRKT